MAEKKLIRNCHPLKLNINGIDTWAKSTFFGQRLSELFLANIFYEKKLLNETYFRTREIEGTRIKCFRDLTRKCDKYEHVIKVWLKAIKEGIKKRYLNRISLKLKNKETGKIVETYTIYYKFYQDGNCRDYRGTDWGKQTKQLFKALSATTQELVEKPQCVSVALNMQYNPNTPYDYIPPGYNKSQGTMKCVEDEASVEIENITTRYHHMQFQIDGAFNVHNDTIIGNRVKGTTNMDSGFIFNDAEIHPNSQDMNVLPQPLIGVIVPESPEPEKNSESEFTRPNMKDLRRNIHCLCNSRIKWPNIQLLTCKFCKRDSHAVCYSILRQNTNTMKHVCLVCSIQNKVECTDPKLCSMSPESKNRFLKMRLIIQFLQVFLEGLNYIMWKLRLDDTEKYSIIKELAETGVIDPSTDLSTVNMENLAKLTNIYFKNI